MRVYKSLILSMVLTVLSFNSFSQNIDSLLNCLSNEENDLNKVMLLGKITANCELKDIKDYCDQSFVLIEKLKTRNIDQKQVLIEEARMYQHLGYYFYKLSFYTKSENYSMKSILLLEKNNVDSALLFSSYNNLASVYMSLNKYDKAIGIFRKNIVFDTGKNDIYSLSLDYNNLSSAYRQLNKNDSAIYYAKKSIYFKLKSSSTYELINSYNLLGIIYLDNKSIDSAEFYNQKAIDLSLKLNNYKALQLLYYWKGMIELSKKNPAKAQSFFLQSLANKTKESNLKSVYSSHYELYNIFYAEGNFKNALYHYKEYKSIKDTVASEALQKESEINQIKFDYSQKEQELKQIRDKELALAKEEQKRKNTTIIFIGILLIILTGFLIFYLNRARILDKQKKFIQAQKDLLHEKQEELILKNLMLNKKNTTITDNISYAQIIQQSLIRSEKDVSKALNKDCFVIFKPKDIVSGDFYWTFTRGDETLLVLADCTGHGVSGAFISILAIKALEKIVVNHQLPDVKLIISSLHEEFVSIFGNDQQNHFGIELVAVTFNFELNRAYVCGSSNSLCYIKNNMMEVLRFDNYSIGNSDSEVKSIQTTELDLNFVSFIYMFTDGYYDQKGGENSKRFQSRVLQAKLTEISSTNTEHQKNNLDQTFNNWKGENEQIDDVTVIGIKLI